MYQLIVVVAQFCFAYPKNKSPIERKQSDQVTTPIDDKMNLESATRTVDQEKSPVGLHGDKGDSMKSEDSLTVKGQSDTHPATPSASSLSTSGTSGYPISVTETMVQKNVNITVSYNPPKSMYTSFDQLRSPRPNCFISSITRVNGQSLPSPGSAVKTTEIKSPEEVTGVKSPSPEAWKVAFETGNGINWTQAKPVTNTITIDPKKVNNSIIDSNRLVDCNENKAEINLMGKNSNQLTNQLNGETRSTNHQQSTFLETNNHLDGSQANLIVTKETIL
ncbi:uncharacterized protein LOC128392531 [Panonychus citri]|uniref:uncharacterized protein LOC128392531 n=1 Tax=Panonychus citri TaxID=50023 RepID=UPI002307EBEC|nr:uncharacterized protein LOC128392531 [Panonychus citri]